MNSHRLIRTVTIKDLITLSAWGQRVFSVLLLTGFFGADLSAQKDNGAFGVWADGDETGAYLVLEATQEEEAGFQLFYRKKTASRFEPGYWYNGRPECVVLVDGRLQVFFSAGGRQSYELKSSRTEMRLWEGGKVLAATDRDGVVVVLARARQAIDIPLAPAAQLHELVMQENIDPKAELNGISGDAADGGARQHQRQLSVQVGEVVLVIGGSENQWLSLAEGPLPIGDGERYAVTALNKTLHVFGVVGTAGSARTGREGQLYYCSLEKGQWKEPEALPVEDVAAVTALTVNQQLRIIAAVAAPSSHPTAGNLASGSSAHFVMGRRVGDGWQFTDSMKEKTGQVMVATVDQVAWAPIDQAIAALVRRSSEDITFAFYSLDDTSPRGIEPVQLSQYKRVGSFMEIAYSRLSEIILLGIAFSLLYWRRHAAFFVSHHLPDHVRLAPLWRRGLALWLDVNFASILPLLILSKLRPDWLEANMDWRFPLKIEGGSQDVLIEQSIVLTILFLVSLVYLAIFEMLYSTTPGKRIFQLAVTDEAGRRPARARALMRNLLRLLDHPLLMLLPFCTKRRQRLGDLAAGTLVVMKNPKAKTPAETEGNRELEDIYHPPENGSD